MEKEKVLWQPINLYDPGYGFGILLDREFAKQAYDLKIDNDHQRRFNQLAGRMIDQIHNPHPGAYQFFENSYLITQFNLRGNGVWLCAEDTCGKNPLDVFEGPIKYHSHNVDDPYQTYGLMALVDLWVTYFDTVKRNSK